MGLGAPASRWKLDRDFGEYTADPRYGALEERGNKDWNGGDLAYIKAPDTVASFFPGELTVFLSHVWKDGVKKTFLPQQSLMGSHRGRVVPDILPSAYSRIPNAAPIPSTPDPTKTSHLIGIANDWTTMLSIKKVKAFTFRGVRSWGNPNQIKGSGGFHPNATRDDDLYLNPPQGPVFLAFQEYMKRRHNKTITESDYTAAITQRSLQFKRLFIEYSLWRALLKGEEMHLGRMLANELLKGYISTTKAISVAKGYAGADGWVYCVLVREGYEVPKKGGTQWTEIFGEQEIAFPGSIPWNDVYAFRKVDNLKFSGPVMLRAGSGYWSQDVTVRVYNLLSGKAQ